MNITHKLELADGFSKSEEVVANFFLENKENALKLSTHEIANETFTSPSTIVRLCKKLGLSGYNEFKEKFLNELKYIEQHFEDIDPNIPFSEIDSNIIIANKLGKLYKETIDDTIHLLSNERLQIASYFINKATKVNIYAISNTLQITHDFKHKMLRINKDVEIMSVPDEQTLVALNSTPAHCGILISYSGESQEVLRIAKILKSKKTPTIAITTIGDNTLSTLCDCVINITSREKLYSKIATFSSNISIEFILDILYSCVFKFNYKKNLDYKTSNSKFIDVRRSSLPIIDENLE